MFSVISGREAVDACDATIRGHEAVDACDATFHVLDALDKACVARVHLQHVANLDEGRNLHHSTRLERSGLGGVGCGVTLEARFGSSNLKLHEHLRLNADELFARIQQRCVVVFLQPLRVVANHVNRNRDLLEGIIVHEVVVGTVVVEVLHLLVLKAYLVKLGTCVEGVVNHTTRLDVAQLGANKSTALAGLYMLKLNNGAQLAVMVNAHAVLEIGGRDSHDDSFQTELRGTCAKRVPYRSCLISPRKKPLYYNHLMR